ncbi:MAG: AMP-binding protein [Burkholderiaceae bacterium]|jgi:phenylacetate-CoA ligase|nr:AMP-binding protein [Burkholderiaceae bacterium]
MTEHFDSLETRPAEAREGALMARLPSLVEHAQKNAPGWAKRLAGVDPREIASRKALAQLPVLRKGDIKALQEDAPPFGGFVTVAPGRLSRLFLSPGPIFDAEGTAEDPWRAARALYAAGIRAGHVVQNCFGYHLTPGAWMIDGAARKIGCAVIPAGVGQIEQQIEIIRALAPDAYTGTPSFLRMIVEKAREASLDISNLKRALLAAEALPPSLRNWLREQGIDTVLQWYGTADVGLIAYESTAMEGMILDEELVLEIVRPGTGEPVSDGEVGEVVVTSFNPVYPLIRFGTGDLSAVLPGISPCGRTNVRIRGWLGRADQTTKVRGMFVHPEQVAELAKRFPQVRRARLVVEGERADDRMTLKCELDGELPQAADARDALAKQLAGALRDITKLRGEVELLAGGALPNDGKVIEDARKYD